MAVTLPVIGQDPWGPDLNLVLSQIGNQAVPDDHGYVTWSFDPIDANSTGNTTNGTLYLSKMQVRQGSTGSRLDWIISGTVGVGPVAGQNWVGIYDSAGTRLAQTNVDADITTTGTKQTALTPFSLPTPFVWAAFLFNAATPPALVRNTTFSGTPNMGLSNAAARAAINGTLLTALPAAIVPASNNTSGSITAITGLAA